MRYQKRSEQENVKTEIERKPQQPYQVIPVRNNDPANITRSYTTFTDHIEEIAVLYKPENLTKEEKLKQGFLNDIKKIVKQSKKQR